VAYTVRKCRFISFEHGTLFFFTTGKEVAAAVVGLMRRTIQRLPPAKIVAAYPRGRDGHPSRTKAFWAKFGPATISVMQDGTHLLAVLWESAWAAGDGESKVKKLDALTQDRAKDIYQQQDFVPSCYINEIGEHLR
jgi:hypothetical protein